MFSVLLNLSLSKKFFGTNNEPRTCLIKEKSIHQINVRHKNKILLKYIKCHATFLLCIRLCAMFLFSIFSSSFCWYCSFSFLWLFS